MKFQCWGVRGTAPTPTAEFLRYGGNTCCVALYGQSGEIVVLDAGTGFCQLGDALMRGEFGEGRGELALLITHAHWDHILGLPFPGIVHLPGNRLTIYGPDSTRGPLRMVYDGLLSPVYSPVYGLQHIGATHMIHQISTEPFMIGGMRVRALPLGHRGGSPIWAYRVDEGERSVAYITDIRYSSDYDRQRAINFARGANMLIHSAPYTRAEVADDYGHARAEDAIEIALAAGVERLMLYHHAPTRTDDQLDLLMAQLRETLAASGAKLLLDAAIEGIEESL